MELKIFRWFRNSCVTMLLFCRVNDQCHCGQVVDNRDGTRSLLNRANKKLLVTFRAENQVNQTSTIIYSSYLFLSRIMTRLQLLCLQLQAPARVPGPWCLFPQEEKLQTPPGSTYLARNYFNLHLLGADCGSSFQLQPVTTHRIHPWPSLSTIIFL